MRISIKSDAHEFEAPLDRAAAQTSKALRVTVTETARDARRVTLDVGARDDDASAVRVKHGVPTVSAARREIMLGEVERPRGAAPFHDNPSAYTGAKVLEIWAPSRIVRNQRPPTS